MQFPSGQLMQERDGLTGVSPAQGTNMIKGLEDIS